MKILVINGPNINMLGIREVACYGQTTYQELYDQLLTYGKTNDLSIEVFQSNHEGDLIDWIQKAYFQNYDGIVINPGGYTHTSIAIRDAILAIAPLPVVEVHISNIKERESFRQFSYLEDVVNYRICGHGIHGYFEAIDYLKNIKLEK